MNNILINEYESILKILNSDIDKLENKSTLITGANGLIGSYIVDFLDYLNTKYNKNIKIYALSRSINKLKKRFKNTETVKLIEQDLNDILNIDFSCDYIIHAASNAHPLAFSLEPATTMKTNFIGTINLLEYAKNHNSKFLYISTGEIYGNNENEPFKETDFGLIDTLSARACYPESKRACETLCISYKNQYEIKVNIARLCYIYGANITETNSRADAQFLRNAIMKQDIVLKSEGKQKRTYCYVADCTSAILTILLKGKSGEAYNVANPDSIVSVKEYAQNLADIANVKLKFELPDEIEKRGYSKQEDSILDSSKLQALGWSAKYDIKEGIEHTYKIKKEML